MNSTWIRSAKLTVATVLSVAVLGTTSHSAYHDDIIVESDYYTQDPKDKAYDEKVLQDKEQLAGAQANVLGSIAELDEQIHRIDQALARYDRESTRRPLLVERERLFRKRREYKRLAASYTQKQVRMTRDLSYNSDAVRGARGDAYANGDLGWSTGEQQGGLENPNWGKANPNAEKGKTLYKVEDEKSMRDVAEKLSEKIYGDFNQDIYVELLQFNMGNTAINPASLLAGDHIFIPYKVAMLTMMGLQQKGLMDATLDVIKDFSDPDLKKQMIKYAVYADENEHARKAFTEVLIAAKLHGPTSDQFKLALTKFHEASDSSSADMTSNMVVTSVDGASLNFRGEFKEQVEVVSNASLQMNSLPTSVREKVKKTAEEFHRLKTYTSDYGADDHRTKRQFRRFKAAVDEAYPAVQAYQRTNTRSLTSTDRYRVDRGSDDSTVRDTRSSALASVELRREIRDMNSEVLKLIRDVADTVKEGWAEREEGIVEGTWNSMWSTHKKEATRKMHQLTSFTSENSVASQLLGRLRQVYGSSYKHNVDLYRSVDFSLLRKRMIALIGMSAVVEQIQPALLSTRDGSFRGLRYTQALQQLGIDVDKRDFDFYDRGEGAKPQFSRLNSRSGRMITKAEGIRNQWLNFVGLLAEMRADMRDQEQFMDTVSEARDFWGDVKDKIDRRWNYTIGIGVAGAGLGTLAAIAAVNFWNPVGWVTAAMIGGGAAIGLVVGDRQDQAQQVEMVKEYAHIKIISDMAMEALREDNVRPVEGMLYLDEITKGYL